MFAKNFLPWIMTHQVIFTSLLIFLLLNRMIGQRHRKCDPDPPHVRSRPTGTSLDVWRRSTGQATGNWLHFHQCLMYSATACASCTECDVLSGFSGRFENCCRKHLRLCPLSAIPYRPAKRQAHRIITRLHLQHLPDSDTTLSPFDIAVHYWHACLCT